MALELSYPPLKCKPCLMLPEKDDLPMPSQQQAPLFVATNCVYIY